LTAIASKVESTWTMIRSSEVRNVIILLITVTFLVVGFVIFVTYYVTGEVLTEEWSMMSNVMLMSMIFGIIVFLIALVL